MNAEASVPPVITVIGAGTVGSCVLEQLGRQETTRQATLVVVDPDQIEPHNLAKSALYTSMDLGRKKASVVADHLNAINPNLDVIPIAQPIEKLRAGLFRISTLVVAAVDNRLAKFHINRSCRAAGTPHLLVAELEGSGSLAARLRCFSTGPEPLESPCLECAYSPEDYALLNHLRQPCSIKTPAPGSRTFEAQPGRLSPAWRLASETVEEVERCLNGRPALKPGQELRLMPEQHQYLMLHAARRPNCLCPHDPIHPTIELQGIAEDFTVGDLIQQVTRSLGSGWSWQIHQVETAAPDLIFAPGAGLGPRELEPLSDWLMNEIWPDGDFLRLSAASGEVVWAGLPVDGLLECLSIREGLIS